MQCNRLPESCHQHYYVRYKENAMNKITLYTVNPSRGNNVRWMLEGCGADDDMVLLDFRHVVKLPEYLAAHPMGKVPAVRYAGQLMTEQPAILIFGRTVSRQKPDSRCRNA